MKIGKVVSWRGLGPIPNHTNNAILSHSPTVLQSYSPTVLHRFSLENIHITLYNGQKACSASASEKTKLYLTKKLSEIEIKLKRSEKKKIIIQIIGSIITIRSMSASVLIASLAFPLLVVTGLSISSADNNWRFQ